MNPEAKAKGRAASYYRNALRQAREDLIKADMHREAESITKALQKAEGIERGSLA